MHQERVRSSDNECVLYVLISSELYNHFLRGSLVLDVFPDDIDLSGIGSIFFFVLRKSWA